MGCDLLCPDLRDRENRGFAKTGGGGRARSWSLTMTDKNRRAAQRVRRLETALRCGTTDHVPVETQSLPPDAEELPGHFSVILPPVPIDVVYGTKGGLSACT